MSLAYTYQRLIDAAQTLDALAASVIIQDGEALGPRSVELLSCAAAMSAVASRIARDRRDALCPEAADESFAANTEGGNNEGV